MYVFTVLCILDGRGRSLPMDDKYACIVNDDTGKTCVCVRQKEYVAGSDGTHKCVCVGSQQSEKYLLATNHKLQSRKDELLSVVVMFLSCEDGDKKIFEHFCVRPLFAAVFDTRARMFSA